jgi:hypothetical protein
VVYEIILKMARQMHVENFTKCIIRSPFSKKERAMRKVGFGLGIVAATLVSAAPAMAMSLPRLTGGAADYVLMPLLGYLGLVVLAQAVALIRGLGRNRT